MGVSILAVQLILVIGFTIFTVNKYAHLRNYRLAVLSTTFFGWSFSFLIIIILPLDVAITYYKKCLNELSSSTKEDEHTFDSTTTLAYEYDNSEQTNKSTMFCEIPRGFVKDNYLLTLWRIVYWGSQFLTWILLPMMQSYAKAGEFTIKGRLKYAFRSNAIYYGLYLVLMISLLIYLISHGISLNFASLKVLIVSASNTWGIFLLVILLGYGLIEVPRHFWRMGIRGHRLQRTYFDIDKLSLEKNEAEELINEGYRETKNALNLLKDSRGDAREKVKIIASKFSHNFVKRMNNSSSEGVANEKDWSRHRANSQTLDVDIVSQDPYLVKLHRKVITLSQTYERTRVQWNSLIKLAFYLEDIEMAENIGKLPSGWSINKQKNIRKNFQSNPFIEKFCFFWHVLLLRPIFQCLSFFFSALTILILWSECTFFIVYPQLSLAARLLNYAAQAYHYKFIQIAAIVLILYLCICAYYTIFHLRIYRYYRLDPNGMTDENSLIFSAMLICRLTAPICLNFLGMIHLDSAITKSQGMKIETQFTKLMGHLEIIPWLAEGINIYLPIVIVLLCLATWFRLGTRFLHNLGIDQFLETDEMTLEMIQSGKALVSLERNRLNRIRGREGRNEAWRMGRSTTTESTSNVELCRIDSSIYDGENRPFVGESSVDERVEQMELGKTNFLHSSTKQGSSSGSRNATTADEVLINLNPQNIFDDL